MPSRGILASRCPSSVLRELRGVRHEFYFEHDLPIPDSFISVVDRALESPGWSHLWFVEEDIVVPPGALAALAGLDSDLAALDYEHKNGVGIPKRIADRRVCWLSLGCTLVRREVFSKIERPFFRTDHRLVSVFTGSGAAEWKFKLVPNSEWPPQRFDYGMQDVYFTGSALIAGCRLGVVEGMRCEHLDINEVLLSD